MFEELGMKALVKQAFSFIADNLTDLMKQEKTRDEIENVLADKHKIHRFFAHFKKQQDLTKV